jgi:hypothetical protein
MIAFRYFPSEIPCKFLDDKLCDAPCGKGNRTNLESVANPKYRDAEIKYGWVDVR